MKECVMQASWSYLVLSCLKTSRHLSWWQQRAVTATPRTKLCRATTLATTTRLHPAQVTNTHNVLFLLSIKNGGPGFTDRGCVTTLPVSEMFDQDPSICL